MSAVLQGPHNLSISSIPSPITSNTSPKRRASVADDIFEAKRACMNTHTEPCANLSNHLVTTKASSPPNTETSEITNSTLKVFAIPELRLMIFRHLGLTDLEKLAQTSHLFAFYVQEEISKNYLKESIKTLHFIQILTESLSPFTLFPEQFKQRSTAIADLLNFSRNPSSLPQAIEEFCILLKEINAISLPTLKNLTSTQEFKEMPIQFKKNIQEMIPFFETILFNEALEQMLSSSPYPFEEGFFFL